MTNQEIVAKLWNLCNVLRDDGITYHQYVTELTYILFLKMAKETGTEDKIPEKYRWDRLVEKDGLALKKFYEELLRELGENCTGRIQEIYLGARSNIEEPANLKKIITNINDLDWYSAKEEGLGNLYEGLLEKNANEKKSGAGQYFTPRVLIDIMTELIAPQPGERCNDPACGTFGFMIAADAYVKAHTDDLFSLTSEQQAFQKNEAFTGAELVHETHRLALMNAMLHDIDGKIYLCDTLSNQGKQMNGFDVVLTNPPFGTKKGGERANRDDFTFQTKSYEKSVEAKPEIISHIYIDYKDRLERGQSCYPLYLEIYNNGTGAAKNLKITTDNVQLTEKFSIFSNNLGFIQPGNSKYVPIGSLNMTMGPNYLSVFDGVLKQEELDKTSFFIEYDNHKKEKIDMNFDYVMSMPHTPLGKTTEETVEEKQAKQVEVISKNIASLNSSLASIDKKIKK